ncbi:rCG24548, isoform CRA_a [Rattus norvegicus]|uniref:RCG24548, isoform CRA_a n=1 Tax=Rattus norvegicus TaxID=10116 RepID=A6JBX4_RAT|nr:rCG24548, isoform CRA_a [Rattus norvegicus]EDM08501.1 rCG24548, isoform CRA_a [Rattus norvegicus]
MRDLKNGLRHPFNQHSIEEDEPVFKGDQSLLHSSPHSMAQSSPESPPASPFKGSSLSISNSSLHCHRILESGLHFEIFVSTGSFFFFLQPVCFILLSEE